MRAGTKSNAIPAAALLLALIGASGLRAQGPEIWLAPNAGRFLELGRAPGEWSATRAALSGVKFYVDGLSTAPEAELSALAAALASGDRPTAVAIEVGGLLNHDWGDEIGERSAAIELEKIARWRRSGGRVDRLEIDGPIRRAFGHDAWGRDPASRFTEVSRATRELADYIEAMRAALGPVPVSLLVNFPNWGWRGEPAVTGTPEAPMRWGDYAAVLPEVVRVLAARGITLDGLVVDDPWEYLAGRKGRDGAGPRVDAARRLRELATLAEEQGLACDVIANSEDGGAGSDAAFLEATDAMVEHLRRWGPRPRRLVLQSWYPHPVAVLPDSDARTQTGHALAVARATRGWISRRRLPRPALDGAPEAVATLATPRPPGLGGFALATRLETASGGAIPILGENGVSAERLVRVRDALRYLLAPVAGARFGAADLKRAVAESLAARGAAIVVLTGDPGRERERHRRIAEDLARDFDARLLVIAAPRCPLEGTSEWDTSPVDDETFERLFALVLAEGIRPALPRYAERLDAALERDGFRFDVPRDAGPPIDVGDTLRPDLRAALRARLWCDRHGMKEASRALGEFLPPDLGPFVATLPGGFRGRFVPGGDPSSGAGRIRHYGGVRARGPAAVELVGTGFDELLAGAGGDDRLEGRGGDDRIDGGAGKDVAVFRGPRSGYEIRTLEDGTLLVRDSDADRDGSDRLRGIERLVFSDGEIDAPSR
ncbi:MAG: hypothetical protein R3F20_13420 [Planctomycetota bacterium]